MLLSIAGAIGGLAAAGAAFFGFHHDGPPPMMRNASSTPPAGWMASSSAGVRADLHFPPAPHGGDFRGEMGSSTDKEDGDIVRDGSSSPKMHPLRPMLYPPKPPKDGSTTPPRGEHEDNGLHLGQSTTSAELELHASTSAQGPRPRVRAVLNRLFHLFGSK